MDEKLADLERLTRLKDQGALTDAEFEAEKSKILASSGPAHAEPRPIQEQTTRFRRRKLIGVVVGAGLLVLVAVIISKHDTSPASPGGSPRPAAIDTASTAGGPSPIPPPEPAGIPKLDEAYGSARMQLLRLGYKPVRASEEPMKVCANQWDANYDPADDDTCTNKIVLPEIESCSGTGMGYCNAYWLAPDGRVLLILVSGEPQPGGISHKSWATRKDLTDLPPNWKPEPNHGDAQ